MSNVPVLDNLLEQHFLSEFNDRWDKIVRPDETTVENQDSNFELILSLIDDLSPLAPGIVATFCKSTVNEQPLMYWWCRRLLLEQVLVSLDSLYSILRADPRISETEFLERSDWIVKKTRQLALLIGEAEEVISQHQFVPTDIEEL